LPQIVSIKQDVFFPVKSLPCLICGFSERKKKAFCSLGVSEIDRFQKEQKNSFFCFSFHFFLVLQLLQLLLTFVSDCGLVVPLERELRTTNWCTRRSRSRRHRFQLAIADG
jgi:predicted nucleic acid-binding Zn ribbon protein